MRPGPARPPGPRGERRTKRARIARFAGTSEVRIGKIIDLVLDAENGNEAAEEAREMCRKLLANPVTEDFRVEVRGEVASHAGGRIGEEGA